MKNLFKLSCAAICLAMTSCWEPATYKFTDFDYGSKIYNCGYAQNEISMELVSIALRLNTLMVEYDRAGSPDINEVIDSENHMINYTIRLFSDATLTIENEGLSNERITITYPQDYDAAPSKDTKKTGTVVVETGGARLQGNDGATWSVVRGAPGSKPLKVYNSMVNGMVVLENWDECNVSTSAGGVWEATLAGLTATPESEQTTVVSSDWDIVYCVIKPHNIDDAGYQAMSENPITIVEALSNGKTVFDKDLEFYYSVSGTEGSVVYHPQCNGIIDGTIKVRCPSVTEHYPNYPASTVWLSFVKNTVNMCNPSAKVIYNDKVKTL